MNYHIITTQEHGTAADVKIGFVREFRPGRFVWIAFGRTSRVHDCFASVQRCATRSLGNVRFEPAKETTK